MKNIKFLTAKSRMAKLFRSKGYSVSQGDTVYITDTVNFLKNLSEFLQLQKQGLIKINCGSERATKKQKGYFRRSEYPVIRNRAAELEQQLKNKRRQFALEIAKNVHEIRPLYTSSRGGIDFGTSGGREHVDYDAYAKSYGFPAKWKNAGVLISNSGFIKVYTSRETLVFEMKMPKVKDFKKYLLEDTGVAAVYGKRSSRGTFKMYNIKNQMFTLAKRMDYGEGKYWEHGNSISEIEQAMAEKIIVWEKAKKAAAERKAAAEKEVKIKRAIRLSKKLVDNITVTYDDAREVGYCQRGVENFIDTHLNGKKIVKISVLKRFQQADRLVNHMHRKCIEERFSKTI